jgi:predicted transcriptional regulator
MSTTNHSIKQAAHQVIDQLPDEANWKDLIYELSVMQDIEEGLADSEAGRVVDNATVRKEFGLHE